MNIRWPAWIVTTLAVSGCVTYAPAAIDSASVAAHQLVHDLGDASVCSELRRLARDRECVGATPDRLDLFAAAVAFNPAVKAADAVVRTAEAEARAARTYPGPVLTLSAEYANDPATTSPWLYGVAGDLPLDFGQRRNGRTRQADAKLALARFDRLEALWTLRMALRKAETDSINAAGERLIFADLSAIRERQLASAGRKLSEGEISRREVDRFRAEASNDVLRRLDAERRSSEALAALAGAIGVPAAQFDNRTLDWSDYAAPTRIAETQLDALAEAALGGRPQVFRAMVAYDQTEASLRTAIAEQFPALSISAGYTWERGLVKLPASVGLALPPADLNQAAIRVAEASRAEAGTHVEEAVHKVLADIDAARASYRTAWGALGTIRSTILVTAHALAQQADREIDAGTIDRVDWASAQAALAQAKLDELAAIGQVRATESQLEDALRAPLSGPEQALGLKQIVTETGR